MQRRGNWQSGFANVREIHDRFCQSITNRQVWLHAVSVGEVNCLHAAHPGNRTADAQSCRPVDDDDDGYGGIVQQASSCSLTRQDHYPIDHRKYVSRALSAVYPGVIVLVERRFGRLHLAGEGFVIPIFLVNARLSDRSYRGLQRFGFLFPPLFTAGGSGRAE